METSPEGAFKFDQYLCASATEPDAVDNWPRPADLDAGLLSETATDDRL